MKVPWHNLKNEAIILDIDKISILAVPKAFQWDQKESENFAQKLKQEKIAFLEMLMQEKAKTAQEGCVVIHG